MRGVDESANGTSEVERTETRVAPELATSCSESSFFCGILRGRGGVAHCVLVRFVTK